MKTDVGMVTYHERVGPSVAVLHLFKLDFPHLCETASSLLSGDFGRAENTHAACSVLLRDARENIYGLNSGLGAKGRSPDLAGSTKGATRTLHDAIADEAVGWLRVGEGVAKSIEACALGWDEWRSIKLRCITDINDLIGYFHFNYSNGGLPKRNCKFVTVFQLQYSRPVYITSVSA